MYPEKGTIWLMYTAAGTPMHYTVSLVHRASLRRSPLVVFVSKHEGSRLEIVFAAGGDHVREPASARPDVSFMPKLLEPREGASFH